MSYEPAPPIPSYGMPMIGTASLWVPPPRAASAIAAASAAWPSANQARFYPIHVPVPILVKRMWVAVGATGGTDTWDVGIYDADFNRLVSKGSTTAGTAATIFFLDITDTYLGPGAYYLAMSSSGTTATTLRWSAGTVDVARVAHAMLHQATAHPLPATATPVAATSSFVPLFGICLTATP